MGTCSGPGIWDLFQFYLICNLCIEFGGSLKIVELGCKDVGLVVAEQSNP